MTTILPDVQVFYAGELYIGAGNKVNYFEGANPVERMVVSSADLDATHVEVAFYENPNNGERTSFPTSVSERTFELVPKVDIFGINGAPVVVR